MFTIPIIFVNPRFLGPSKEKSSNIRETLFVVFRFLLTEQHCSGSSESFSSFLGKWHVVILMPISAHYYVSTVLKWDWQLNPEKLFLCKWLYVTLDLVDACAALYNISLWLHVAHYMISRAMLNVLCTRTGGGICDNFTCLSGSRRNSGLVPVVWIQFKDGATASHN